MFLLFSFLADDWFMQTKPSLSEGFVVDKVTMYDAYALVCLLQLVFRNSDCKS